MTTEQEFPDPIFSRENIISELIGLGVKEHILRRDGITDTALFDLLKGLRRLKLMYGDIKVHN